jgi:hypothetical protein
MKSSFTCFLLAFICFNTLAQAPDGFNYQGIARDNQGKELINKSISLRLSILKNSVGGTSVYSETQAKTTNSFGLFTIKVGSGTVISGKFNQIDWSTGLYFLKVEMDVNGGTNYSFMGTSQLLSVPYALMATRSLKSLNDLDTSSVNELQTLSINYDTIRLSNGGGYVKLPPVSGGYTHYVGELYGGGVVFYVDQTGKHGLVCSMIDLSTSQMWSNVTATLIGPTAQSVWDGQSNSIAIIGQTGHTNSAAKLCEDYTNFNYGTGVYSDWYLPSITELNDLLNNIRMIQRTLINDGDPTTTPLVANLYWSSTENVADGAAFFNLSSYSLSGNWKYSAYYVRAIRAF